MLKLAPPSYLWAWSLVDPHVMDYLQVDGIRSLLSCVHLNLPFLFLFLPFAKSGAAINGIEMPRRQDTWMQSGRWQWAPPLGRKVLTRPSTSGPPPPFPLCFTSWSGLLACVANCDADVRGGRDLFWLAVSRWVKSNHDGWGRGALASILEIWKKNHLYVLSYNLNVCENP